MFYIFLAFLLGMINIISKSLNFETTKLLGISKGAFLNYFIATITSLSLCFIFHSHFFHIKIWKDIPIFLYLGGIFGIIAFVLNISSLNKMNLLQSTVLLIIGQFISSIIIDTLCNLNISLIKIIGVTIMSIGIIGDKKLSTKKEYK